ncbi:MAG TPA: YebC/PmpR family DNA-binding transcriptional regulator, partial [Candidatus Latescibacteria bacterium]|nr:YebC/PmpR family DNA-binding transcriptional regulator [Candidatus Latescibacterota bacterium]
FERHGGHLGENGSVSWMFQNKGLIVLERNVVDEETLMMVALEAGAEDIREMGDTYEVITEPGDLEDVKKALEENGIPYIQAELTKLPQTTVHVEGSDAERLLKLLDALEEHEDVRKVYSNFEMDDALMEALAG